MAEKEVSKLAAVNYGRLVKEMREARGWSQQTLADRAGIDRVSVSNLERNKSKPREGTLASVANALGLDFAQFLEGRIPPEFFDPLEAAKKQADRLESREARSSDEDDEFWMRLSVIAEACMESTFSLLQLHKDDLTKRRESEMLLERFAGLHRRTLDRYLEMHGTSFTEILKEEREAIGAA